MTVEESQMKYFAVPVETEETKDLTCSTGMTENLSWSSFSSWLAPIWGYLNLLDASSIWTRLCMRTGSRGVFESSLNMYTVVAIKW